MAIVWTEEALQAALQRGGATILVGHLREGPPVDPVPPPVSEKAFMSAVIKLAQQQHWLVYHTFRATRSQPGFPDLTMARTPRLVIAELKAADGVVTIAQQHWLEVLQTIPHVECYLWTPEDWPTIRAVLLDGEPV